MRTEDPRFLTTGGVYTADVEDEQLAGACHVHALRPFRVPAAHEPVLRPTPPSHHWPAAFICSSRLSPRHLVTKVNPGSTSSNPSKKRKISARLRYENGVFEFAKTSSFCLTRSAGWPSRVRWDKMR